MLIASEFILGHERFPRSDLAKAAPKLRWMHVTNAGVEKLLPLRYHAGCARSTSDASVDPGFCLATI